MLCFASSQKEWDENRGPTWYVDEKVVIRDDLATGYNNVAVGNGFIPVIAQADGQELGWILERFQNLPYPKDKRVVRWYGDMARMIWDSLPRHLKEGR